MTTKRTFQKVAEILRDAIEDPEVRTRVAREFERYFTEENPRFDPQKFWAVVNGGKSEAQGRG